MSNFMIGDLVHINEDLLQVVYENGELRKEFSFEQVRNNAAL